MHRARDSWITPRRGYGEISTTSDHQLHAINRRGNVADGNKLLGVAGVVCITAKTELTRILDLMLFVW